MLTSCDPGHRGFRSWSRMSKQRNVNLIALAGLAVLCSPEGMAAAREKGPTVLVVSAARGKGRDIEALSLGRRRSGRFLTRDGGDKVGLRCLAGGRSLLYVSDGKVMELDLSTPGAKAGPARKLADLPKGLVRAAGTGIGRFLAPSTSGRFLALPHDKGIFLVDRARGKARLIEPRCALPGPTAPKRCASGTQRNRLVFVHPVFWAFKQHRFLFVAMKPNCPSKTDGHGGTRGAGRRKGRRDGLESKKNRVDLVAGLYDVDLDKTLACVSLAKRVRGPVTGLDASWRDDGKALALSVGTAGSGRIQRILDIAGTGKQPSIRAARPHRLSVGRFHGWRGRWLTATARRGRLVGLWRWKPGTARKPVRIRALTRSQRLLVYEPSLRSFLLEVPGRKHCNKTRLLVVRRERRSRALFKWAVWSRLITRDWSGRWGLFQVGAGCGRGKVRALVARLDGRRVVWTSRRHKRLGRHMEPGRAALCTIHK